MHGSEYIARNSDEIGHEPMKSVWHIHSLHRFVVIALPLAMALIFLLPMPSEAHAVLLRSDPADGALLYSAPTQVRMWFSEDLNATFSTAQVMNRSQQHVDIQNAHVTTQDAREIDVSLQANLSPGVYIVLWRTQSTNDGHVLSGSFLFNFAAADGSVPGVGNASIGTNPLSTNTRAGQLDGPTLFSFVMITLVELAVVFWVGAQLWRTFAMPPAEESAADTTIQQRGMQRFERLFSVPVLLVILLANIGVLLGQGLVLTAGRWDQAIAPSLLLNLASNGRFGTYWIMREAVVLLALLCAVYVLLVKQRSHIINEVLSWANFVLGLALLIAVALSGHAAAVDKNVVVYAVLVDWLHLLAAALWIGGMMYISAIYLPVLQGYLLEERIDSLLSTLACFSPMAVTGVIVMAISGPFNATMHMTAFGQLLNTAYGRTLDVKVTLVAALLVTSAIHVGLFRPQLVRDYQKYRASLASTPQQESEEKEITTENVDYLQQQRRLQAQITQQTARMVSILRWEPFLGIAVLICTGLLNIFAGTLAPTTVPIQQPSTQPRPYITTVQTTDKQFTVKLVVSPNRFGPNVFTAQVTDSTGKPDTNVGVSLYVSMLDMDMGTTTINLQPDDKGGFSGGGNLDMGGNWQLRIQIRTPDNTLHETKVQIFASW